MRLDAGRLGALRARYSVAFLDFFDFSVASADAPGEVTSVVSVKFPTRCGVPDGESRRLVQDAALGRFCLAGLPGFGDRFFLRVCE